MQYDVAIIGAGVVGCAIARELARYRLKIAVLEKEVDVSFGTTKANSGIVHAGFHSRRGTPEASLCVRGNRLFPSLAGELDVPYKQNGSVMVAQDQNHFSQLDLYLRQGIENGIAGLRIVKRSELLHLEPNLSPALLGALLAPTGAIVAPFELCVALAENARDNGVEFFFQSPLASVEYTRGEYLLHAGRAVLRAKYMINAAGLHAAKVASLIGDDSFLINARKGEEYVFDRELDGLVTRTIYPFPTQISKGILVIPTVDGNLMLGPTAVDVDDLTDLSTTGGSWREILEHAMKMVPALDATRMIASFTGLRATASLGHFIIGPSPMSQRWINVAGIDSPGLTAAPAIAEYVVTLLHERGLNLTPESRFQPERKVKRFRCLSLAEQDGLIVHDPLFGRIVCRCEKVTEAEVVEAIERGATTLDGIKFRTRAGMGRCQGGFCSLRIINILARELGIDPACVTKRGGTSFILAGHSRRMVV